MNKQRIITAALAALVIVLVGVAVMFAFGAPQRPVGRTTETASASAVPPVAAAGDLSAAEESQAVQAPSDPGGADAPGDAGQGAVPEPDPSSPFAIEIPGCVCHSDDPALVQQHAEYRMNQCFGCHAGGMPEMGQ